MSLASSLAARPLPGVALTLLLFPGRALAGPGLAYEPALDPRLALDPRAELDFRLEHDEDERPRGHPRAAPLSPERPAPPLHAPVWISIGATYRRLPGGDASFGAVLLLGLPLERIAASGVSAALADDARPAPPAPGAPPPEGVPPGKRKLDLTPPAPPAKLPLPAPVVTDVPLRVPVVVTPAAARAAVEAALKRARLADPDARLDALATRARTSAALPELRLRVMRTVDDGQTLSPTSYDPARILAIDAVRFWLEARATWRLDRLLFAEEEVALERMRHERAEAASRLTREVLKLLFEWQRALATADNPTLPAEEHLSAQLKAIEVEAELDLYTDGWFARWRAAR